MMDAVGNTQNTGQTASAGGQAAQSGSSSTGFGADFETFLKMLTTQLKNQDPMSPMESSEFSVQLATFSGVEQQVRTNELLGGLGAQLQLSGLGDVAGWIGMEARATAPAYYHGNPITVLPKVDAEATRAVLVVKNADGAEVQRFELESGEAPVQWSGLQSDETPLPDGVYSFSVESYVDGQLKSTAPADVYTRVAEVRMAENGTQVVLEDGTSVASSEITALRYPQAN